MCDTLLLEKNGIHNILWLDKKKGHYERLYQCIVLWVLIGQQSFIVIPGCHFAIHTDAKVHRCVKVKSGKIVVLLEIISE